MEIKESDKELMRYGAHNNSVHVTFDLEARCPKASHWGKHKSEL